MAAIAAGVTVFTARPVEYIAREAGVWRPATQEGNIRTKWAVVSTETYTSRILSALSGEQVVLPYSMSRLRR
ncbi:MULTISPECIES: hypothetical protein [Mesorhizobium]|uniref:Uncharacterized protein n=1 Tax=Mesorhizobium wenxiniae TaxID=2014805 RepID=A0A271K6X7_9HYPH|nr:MULTISPECIES: hypothetical protein [Mesorhizobium]MCF6115202.1 hypothetical protein [Mesorhizobium muleiense]PAP91513.1 hypothetical protein CIT31_32330 [Mesorhizobium wenxiniae]RVD13099.1 hypothetical protein EN749_24820 [Mesorhizobium sp. M7A.F.Ca.ET.027.02.1.1]RWC97173.1 MAG: hypothetical protein EOS73_32895 [Mesorhizobium sp.]RWD38872.1 MAG: hypothetical protein EOS59_33495 [Mesorhizobium sp.]